MRVPISIALFTALSGVSSAHADATRDLNPLLSGFELPPALPHATAEATTLAAQFSIGNVSLNQQAHNESLQLDAELQRWQFTVAKPLNQNWSVRIELPYLRISGGQLDSFIQSWHRTFGLPNGNRAQVPQDRLLITHSTAGVVDYSRTSSSAGIGDITLRVGRAFDSAEDWHQALWLGVKLPSGNAAELTGSGATDVALSWSIAHAWNSRINTQAQLSASWLGKGERFADAQQSLVWSGSLGSDLRISTHWLAAVQLDAHSKVFDSSLRVLGDALQLSFGPAYESKHWRTSFSISEDIAVDTAPDVQFQIDVTRRF